MSSQFDTGMGTTPGMWEMVSQALEDEKLPESANNAIHALCEGRAAVVPDVEVATTLDECRYLTIEQELVIDKALGTPLKWDGIETSIQWTNDVRVFDGQELIGTLHPNPLGFYTQGRLHRRPVIMGVGPNGTLTEIPKSVMDGLYKIMCGLSSDFSKHEISDSAKPGMQSAMRFVLEYGERNGFGMRG